MDDVCGGMNDVGLIEFDLAAVNAMRVNSGVAVKRSDRIILCQQYQIHQIILHGLWSIRWVGGVGCCLVCLQKGVLLFGVVGWKNEK
jgi:hypothetical protein